MGKRKKQQFWTKERRIGTAIIGGVIAAVICVAIVVFVVGQQRNAEPGGATKEEREAAEASAKQAEADGALREKARSALLVNDTATAEKIYEDAANKAANDTQKVQLYIDLSAVYYAQKRYNEAFLAGKKAETMSSDRFLVADWLSRLYEDQKMYKEAAEQYEAASKQAASPQNVTGLNAAYYLRKAGEMRQLGGAS